MIKIAKRNLLLNIYFIITAVCILTADQVTKYMIMQRVPENSSIELIPGLLSITHVRNTGAAFGLFQGYTEILTVISIVAIVLIIVLKSILNFNSAFYNVCLGFVMGGALGNLIDRFLVGEVTDFINVRFIPVFNIADSCILIGFSLIVILILKEYFKKGKTEGVD
jgi:signal peptidase II